MSSLDHLRAVWFTDGSETTPTLAKKHRIVDDLRSVIDRVLGLDPDALGSDELDALVEQVAVLRAAFDATPDLRTEGDFGPLANAPPPHGMLVERSPVSGRSNALAVPLRYSFDDQITRAEAVFSRAYEGPPGGVHGGYVAAALDEVLGVAQMATGQAGFTGTLQIRYHAITPIGERITYVSGPGDRDGRKLRMWARSYADSELVSEAEGVFISLATF